MKRTAVTCLMLAFFTGSVFSQAVSICGTVTDQNGQPLTNTVVRLGQTTYDNGYWAQAPYLAKTDGAGHYQLGTGVCPPVNVISGAAMRGETFSRPMYVGGKVLFSLPAGDAMVRMSIYDLAGRFVRDVMNKSLSRGSYSVSIDTRGISCQFYLLRVTINGSAYVMKLQPSSHVAGGAVVRSASGFQTRLEKLAAIVDTVHATQPGYSIGAETVSSLTGNVNFTLTRVTTWDGTKAAFDAFWGDTSTYPKTGSYVILNRTNGKWPDSKIGVTTNRGGATTPLSQTNLRPIGALFIYIAPTDSNMRYYDFLEVNGGGTTFLGNTTRVDGWRLPITFRIKTSDGKDTVMGDSYELFYQSRESKFAEFINEVPKEFTWEATHDFANIWAPHKMDPFPFRSTGPYGNYYERYQDSVIKNYVKDPAWVNKPGYGAPANDPGPYPAATQADDVFACAGVLGNLPIWAAALNRHVSHLPQGVDCYNWSYVDTAYYYTDAPANFYSRWCHRRAINNYCYGFPYDDNGDHEAYISIGNIQWMAVAIGW
ncbi:MAG TPA: beta-1,3-glucanase family protein [Chitinivibrionales bacterium]|nr:beta-1,3-glucanase family protein [Chitinivibrionales bacterium]